jgi:hypothetical protein
MTEVKGTSRRYCFLAVEDGFSDIPAFRSYLAKQHKNEKDDQNGADATDAPVAIAIAIAAEPATEAAEQENNKEDNKDGSKRHDCSSLCLINATLRFRLRY